MGLNGCAQFVVTINPAKAQILVTAHGKNLTLLLLANDRRVDELSVGIQRSKASIIGGNTVVREALPRF